MTDWYGPHTSAVGLQAVRVGVNARGQGDVGRIMVVLLTDGRANVSLAKSNADPEAIKEGAPRPSTDDLKEEVSLASST